MAQYHLYITLQGNFDVLNKSDRGHV